MADKSMANSQTKKAAAASKLLANKRIDCFKVFDTGVVLCKLCDLKLAFRD